MKKFFLLMAMAINFLTAAAFRIEYGSNVTISKPVYEDVYIAGGTININAPIYGDLIIAGGTIFINDTVLNDIILAGGNVTFNGFVGDDIRCAGGNITIQKNVTGDVVIAGGTVNIISGVTIGGLLASGGNITLDGNVAGEIRGAFGKLIINGNIAKDIDCRGGEITINGTIGGKAILAAKDIIIGSNAAFANDVRYWNRKNSLDFKQTLKNSKANFDPSLRINTGEWYYLGAVTILGLLWYLGMALLMILIMQYLFEGIIKKAADTVYTEALPSFGFGLLFLITVPVAAVLAFITIIGVPVGILMVAMYITLLLLSTVITSVVIANWFNNRNHHHWNFWQRSFAAFGAFIALKLITITHIIGWVLVCIMISMAFGGIIRNINWRKNKTIIIQ
jgi:hypothetical protein